MQNVNGHKIFTASGDERAERLLEKVLLEIRETLSGSDFSVVLGGSYGRGNGGVRVDSSNDILYNDLDFFVFGRRKSAGAAEKLDAIAKKYEHQLKVDVDFSRLMTVRDIKNNAPRLMMQELKRGYVPVYGEDLLKEYLAEIPADQLPFSEACRLLLNRGMGLLLAGEKISQGSPDSDFILRNIYKAILGACDAMLIADGIYLWKIDERLEFIEKSDLPDTWKTLYREAVAFKSSPDRKLKDDMIAFWNSVRDLFQFALRSIPGGVGYEDLRSEIYKRCRKGGETSLKNYIKYCIKSRTLPLADWKYHTIPAAALLAAEIYPALDNMPVHLDRQGKLYRHWLIFN